MIYLVSYLCFITKTSLNFALSTTTTATIDRCLKLEKKDKKFNFDDENLFVFPI